MPFTPTDNKATTAVTIPGRPRSVTYSICVCNYNMADTIEQALVSVLDQIDENFEVLVVDDGSNDDSLAILESLSKRYPALRYVALKRDRRRLLGETRNISIREARGKYVLPQFDCDDVYQPCIVDFVKVFHQLERCFDRDIYLKGSKLNIGSREFLLDHGPYRNMFKEDRDMWIRLSLEGVLVPLDHENIFKRLPKTKPQSLRRALYKTWAHLQADYRSKLPFWDPFRMLFSRHSTRSYRVRISRFVFSSFAYITAQFMEPLPMPEGAAKGQIKKYRDKNLGTFPELMRRHNRAPDFSELSAEGRMIFCPKTS